nr:MAG TPA: hypothetical protein [Caudoviricetes sp.]DAH53876.1 MAG TPA: hypothetical protein [Caudoviricetes sp.]
MPPHVPIRAGAILSNDWQMGFLMGITDYGFQN